MLRHTSGDYELILVDNGSTDETPLLFKELADRPCAARVEVIRNDENKGFAAGVNQGLRNAQGEYIVLLNNDTVVTPHWLEDLIAWSLTDWPKVGMVGPMTNYTAAPQLIEAGYRDLSDLDEFALKRRALFRGRALDVPRLTGFCLLIRRAVLEALGGSLDERYGLTRLFEDDDLSHLAARQRRGSSTWRRRTCTFTISAAAPSPDWASTLNGNSTRTFSGSATNGARKRPVIIACPRLPIDHAGRLFQQNVLHAEP